tara:strand:- start:15848 stop:16123 length:276 start_codon:yes stop_codon:yes gene_type:complete
LAEAGLKSFRAFIRETRVRDHQTFDPVSKVIAEQAKPATNGIPMGSEGFESSDFKGPGSKVGSFLKLVTFGPNREVYFLKNVIDIGGIGEE